MTPQERILALQAAGAPVSAYWLLERQLAWERAGDDPFADDEPVCDSCLGPLRLAGEDCEPVCPRCSVICRSCGGGGMIGLRTCGTCAGRGVE